MGKNQKQITLDIQGKISNEHLILLQEKIPKIKEKKTLHLEVSSGGGDSNVAKSMRNIIARLKEDGVEVTSNGKIIVGSAALLLYLQGSFRTLDPLTKVIIDLPHKIVEKKILLGNSEIGQYLQGLIEENNLLLKARQEWVEEIARITLNSVGKIFEMEEKELSCQDSYVLGFCHSLNV